ncbi:hypothetical protein B0J11DRAFT_34002 [Dendryphion nanum]|uniref:Uncharacterized protein n=1 Tax=Dendryphion nanum TaxID=256645 RepID=A0A9P9EGD0_9PLEO|nr:hypothetical protein B0J11DRAFT_34002 [Dendryphion nanum]
MNRTRLFKTMLIAAVAMVVLCSCQKLSRLDTVVRFIDPDHGIQTSNASEIAIFSLTPKADAPSHGWNPNLVRSIDYVPRPTSKLTPRQTMQSLWDRDRPTGMLVLYIMCGGIGFLSLLTLFVTIKYSTRRRNKKANGGKAQGRNVQGENSQGTDVQSYGSQSEQPQSGEPQGNESKGGESQGDKSKGGESQGKEGQSRKVQNGLDHGINADGIELGLLGNRTNP